MNIGINLT